MLAAGTVLACLHEQRYNACTAVACTQHAGFDKYMCSSALINSCHSLRLLTADGSVGMVGYSSCCGPQCSYSNSSTYVVQGLGVTLTDGYKRIKVESPAKRKGGVMVASVAELMDKLKNEAKVL